MSAVSPAAAGRVGIGVAIGIGIVLALTIGLPSAGAPGERVRDRPGPGLRSGLKALESDAHDTAARLFAETGATHTIIGDHAARWEAEALLRGGHPARAAALAGASAGAEPRGLLAGAFARIEARAHAELGQPEAARAAFLRAAELESDHDDRAELLAEIARSYQGEGDAPAARDAWLEIWRDLPETPAGADAAAALETLDAADPKRRDDAALLRTRCDALTDARRNGAALATCTRARKRATGARARRQLDQRRADLLFRLRRYPEAHLAYDALPGREARFRAARSLARLGDISESIAAFERLAEGSDVLAFRARFLAATLWEDRETERARAHFRAVAEGAPQASQRLEANWRLGWSAYRAGLFAEAEERLRGVAKNARDPIEALRGRYWSAQSAVRAGDAGGLERLARIAREFPFTYYGWRAAGLREAGLREAGSREAGGTPAAARGPEAQPRAHAAEASRLPPRILDRARILIEAGLPEDAVRELSSVRRRARSQSDRLLLASLYQDAGNPNRAQRIILDRYLLDLARGPRDANAELWWSAYPNAYANHVEAAVTDRAVEAPLVYAVMREESGYRPKVLSLVGARGLAQIMPETGRRLAAQLGDEDFDPDDLFVPERNLDLAGHYLESLLRRFGGRSSAAIASYNAGPTAVARWLAAGGELGDDEWVEAIPYDQTRAYVKRVLRSVYAYEVLY